MSRSTGWQSPAVPPVRSASQPGENASEQPRGICAGACCGVPPPVPAARRHRPARRRRRASRRSIAHVPEHPPRLAVNGLQMLHRSSECVTHRASDQATGSASTLVAIELCQIRWIPLGELTVHPADRRPSSRESTRKSAGSGASSPRTACALRGSTLPSTTAAPSTCCNRSCRRCGASRETPSACRDRSRGARRRTCANPIRQNGGTARRHRRSPRPGARGRRRTDTLC